MKIINLVERLPDDIILYIYTKCLKRYRFYNGELIKLIDFDKYKFLEKFTYRKIKAFNSYNYSNDNDNVIKYRIRYQLPNMININRNESFIDDDMIFITFTITDNSLIFDVDRFRLKKKEDIIIKSQMNIYHKGDYTDYDWEVVTYSYEI